ncbi:MAG: head GIN domain-containing protein [Bacteroidota bacterium]|nr:head GIN domain-containing protein [Bacteroidota bacterium]
MKHFTYTFFLLIIFACDQKNAWDCIQTSGPLVIEELTLEPFEKILVNRDISLTIKQGTDYKVDVETGENLMGDIEISVVGKQLQLSDNNRCNLVRDYGLTKMTVTTPYLNEIRSCTQYLTTSEGVLNFENLNLISENYNSDFISSGNFNLKVNSQTLSITANNLSVFRISGSTDSLSVQFFGGVCEFKGDNLIAEHINIFQRSSHDMTLNPQQSLEGEIRSTGNVISVHTPAVVNVEQFYMGQLFFLD